MTPLQRAILGDHEAVARLLVAKGADVNAMDNLGITVLDEATRMRNAGIIELLKQAGAKCGTSNYAC
jgi:ankyrin repeat protein